MTQDRFSGVPRRRFLQRTLAAGASCVVGPIIVPRHVLGGSEAESPSETVRIGFIGTGKRARDLIEVLPLVRGAKLVAICDCYTKQMDSVRAEFKAEWPGYQHYEKMFAKERLDGVMVATMGFQRVLPCIHACRAGLDVYAEKPISHTVREGRAMVEVVRKYRRVYQAGTQQRSIPIDQYACELIRGGGIGTVKVVVAQNYLGPSRYTGPFPAEPLPDGLDWDRYCSWTPLYPFSSKQMAVARQHTCGYGHGAWSQLATHGLDMVQFALGMDETGPVEIEPVTEKMPSDKWERVKNCPLVLRYASGVEVRLETAPKGGGNWSGAVFRGEKGNIEIKRNALAANPAELCKDAPVPCRDGIKDKGVPRELVAVPHIQNWVDCIKSRSRPNAHEEIAQRSNTVTLLAHMARELGRKLVWDSASETFPGDNEANALLDVPRRKGYELPTLT